MNGEKGEIGVEGAIVAHWAGWDINVSIVNVSSNPSCPIIALATNAHTFPIIPWSA